MLSGLTAGITTQGVRRVICETCLSGSLACGADYLVFSKGALITVSPTPPDAEGWAYGRLNQMQGWLPPAYVEADEHDSALPIELGIELWKL